MILRPKERGQRISKKAPTYISSRSGSGRPSRIGDEAYVSFSAFDLHGNRAAAPCDAMGEGKEDERMQGDSKEDSDIEVEPERLQYKVSTTAVRDMYDDTISFR